MDESTTTIPHFRESTLSWDSPPSSEHVAAEAVRQHFDPERRIDRYVHGGILAHKWGGEERAFLFTVPASPDLVWAALRGLTGAIEAMPGAARIASLALLAGDIVCIRNLPLEPARQTMLYDAAEVLKLEILGASTQVADYARAHGWYREEYEHVHGRRDTAATRSAAGSAGAQPENREDARGT